MSQTMPKSKSKEKKTELSLGLRVELVIYYAHIVVLVIYNVVYNLPLGSHFGRRVKVLLQRASIIR